MADYLNWFGFRRLPFRLRPDPEFLYLGGALQRASDRLHELVGTGTDSILLLGRSGSGKSTLLRALGTPGSRPRVISLLQPLLTPAELRDALRTQLQPAAAGDAPADAAAQLEALPGHAAASGQPILVVVDGAHALPADTLAELESLALPHAPLRWLLAAQPSAVEVLAAAAPKLLKSMSQIELPALDLAGTQAYIAHRLAVAGADGGDRFDRDAIGELQRCTGGNPALINRLCDASLLHAKARSLRTVSLAEVRAAVHEINLPPPAGEPAPRAALRATRANAPDISVPLGPGRLVIGRAPDSGLRLEGEFVSRRHCQVLTTPAGSIIEDLDSTNGFLANGQASRRHQLQPGDTIVIGQYTLTYSEPDA